MRILVINPGSTSTKIAVYEDEQPLLLRNIRHTVEELSRFERIVDQHDFRRDLVVRELRKLDVQPNFDVIIGRGGLAKPVAGGVYEVNEQMCHDMYHAVRRHVSNLGCVIAYELAASIPGCKAFIADPVVVDEMEEVARVSGLPEVPRVPVWHALNQRAIGRRFARENGQRYEDLNLIICHLGGGISVAAHAKGRAVDANNGLDGEGPFSPERAGSLPPADLVRLCFSGRYTEDELLKQISGQGGLAAHLGTTDVRDVIRRIEGGDKRAELLLDAMIYQTAKCIAAEGAVLCGKIDAILITGGMAHSDYITSRLRRRISFLGPVHVYPGEDEMQALALNALAVLRGQRELKQYV
ncbi:MAG: butyrate kinase [Bacteroidales bacterium]|nr:butyrate kinase [Bacteroidales bacterium]